MIRISYDDLTPEQKKRVDEIRSRITPEVLKKIEDELVLNIYTLKLATEITERIFGNGNISGSIGGTYVVHVTLPSNKAGEEGSNLISQWLRELRENNIECSDYDLDLTFTPDILSIFPSGDK